MTVSSEKCRLSRREWGGGLVLSLEGNSIRAGKGAAGSRALLIIIAVPPGLALLIKVVDEVIHGWRDHGCVIDARGTGRPIISEDKSLPYGTVIILTRDGDTAKRTDLRGTNISEYVGAALKAVAGGASASNAMMDAGAALAG